MTAKTSEKLALELDGIAPAMAARAREDFYHDFFSPLPAPELQLVYDLLQIGTREALALRERVINGEFDATTEEGDEWIASADGKSALEKLVRKS